MYHRLSFVVAVHREHVLPAIFSNSSKVGSFEAEALSFPAAEILLSASILLVTTFLNLFIYTQRWRIDLFTSQNDVDSKIETRPGHANMKNDIYQLSTL